MGRDVLGRPYAGGGGGGYPPLCTPPSPLPMFEADSQHFASVPRGFTLQKFRPAFGGDYRGTFRGGGPSQPPPPPPPNPACTRNVHLDAPGTGKSPSLGHPTPGVVKQDKSSGGSVDTTKTRSGPRRVRMCSGERPIGAAKGKQPNTEALCQPPPLLSSPSNIPGPGAVVACASYYSGPLQVVCRPFGDFLAQNCDFPVGRAPEQPVCTFIATPALRWTITGRLWPAGEGLGPDAIGR